MPSTDASIAPLHPADRKRAAPILRFCSRCRVNKATILLQSASYCPDCLQFTFEGKVRQGLEQSRLCTYLHRTEGETSGDGAQAFAAESSKYACQGRIAIGFSGGAASRVLLHLAKSRLLPDPNHRRGGKTKEIRAIDVIYVDDSDVIDGAEDRTEEVKAIVEEEGGEKAGLFFKAIKMHSIYHDDRGVQCTAESAAPRHISLRPESIANQREALLELFRSIQPRATPKGMLANARSRSEDLLLLFTLHLLRREAIRHGASCLLTGETSTRMAVKLIDAIGKGKGHKLPLEQNAIRWHGLFVLKPMKEVSRKEVTCYSRLKGLRSLTPFDITATQLLSSNDGISGHNGDKASMGRLTESLIHLLEKNVASTVSTINKAGDKLVFSDEAAAHEDIEENLDKFASSSTAFVQIGPSISLRHCKRQDSTSVQMSKMSLVSSFPSGSNGSTVGEPGDRSLQGLGLGRMGSSLYFAAQKMMPYNGELACPLCQMPSQRGLHAWKRGLTVSAIKMTSDKVEKRDIPDDRIDLTKYLCYACSNLLDTPENAVKDAKMTLPSFVLSGVQDRIKDSASATTVNEYTPAKPEDCNDDPTVAMPPLNERYKEQNGRFMQKVERSEMKKHLNGFLLNDEKIVQTPPIQQERQQMDW